MKFIFDLDGTICPIRKENESYEELIPFKEMVEKIRFLKDNGHSIVIFTSRNMKTYNEDISLIKKNTLPKVISWLKKHDIPYDEVIVGKPWPGHEGCYIDDRTLRPNEILNLEITEIEKYLEKDRLN